MSNRAVFNQFEVCPICKLFEEGPETRQHFLTESQKLQVIRQKFYIKIPDIMDSSPVDKISPNDMTQLIFDLSVFCEGKFVIYKLALYSRELTSSLH